MSSAFVEILEHFGIPSALHWARSSFTVRDESGGSYSAGVTGGVELSVTPGECKVSLDASGSGIQSLTHLFLLTALCAPAPSFGDFFGDFLVAFFGDFLVAFFGDFLVAFFGDFFGDFFGELFGDFFGELFGDFFGDFFGELFGDRMAALAAPALMLTTVLLSGVWKEILPAGVAVIPIGPSTSLNALNSCVMSEADMFCSFGSHWRSTVLVARAASKSERFVNALGRLVSASAVDLNGAFPIRVRWIAYATV